MTLNTGQNTVKTLLTYLVNRPLLHKGRKSAAIILFLVFTVFLAAKFDSPVFSFVASICFLLGVILVAWFKFISSSIYAGESPDTTWPELLKWCFDGAIIEALEKLSVLNSAIAPNGWTFRKRPSGQERIRAKIYESKHFRPKIDWPFAVYFGLVFLVTAAMLSLILIALIVLSVWVSGAEDEAAQVIRWSAMYSVAIYAPGSLVFFAVFAIVCSPLNLFFPHSDSKKTTIYDAAVNFGKFMGGGTIAGLLIGTLCPVIVLGLRQIPIEPLTDMAAAVIEPQTLVSSSFIGGIAGMVLGMVASFTRSYSTISNMAYRTGIQSASLFATYTILAVTNIGAPSSMNSLILDRLKSHHHILIEEEGNYTALDVYHEFAHSFSSTANAAGSFYLTITLSVLAVILFFNLLVVSVRLWRIWRKGPVIEVDPADIR